MTSPLTDRFEGPPPCETFRVRYSAARAFHERLLRLLADDDALAAGERAAGTLAQKLGQLQPYIACSHGNVQASLYFLGQRDTFLACSRRRPRVPAAAPLAGRRGEGKIHWVGPECARWPSSLTGNPDCSLKVGPQFVPAL